MADIPEVPEWLARKISNAIRTTNAGQAILNWNEHRVASYDLREVGKVSHSPPDPGITVKR
jgi:hypothetical protein